MKSESKLLNVSSVEGMKERVSGLNSVQLCLRQTLFG